ncbi:hypothetical protein YW3DRAFT_07358, partial [Streptomyces sp. MnatMP-M77]
MSSSRVVIGSGGTCPHASRLCVADEG